jgi:hypothetical protein
MKTKILSCFLGVSALLGLSCSGGKPGTGLILEVDPPMVTFGVVKKGEQDQRIVTLRHVGTEGTIKIHSIELDKGTSDEFEVTMPALTELNVGQETTFTIVYRPKDSIVDSGAVIIRHNVAPDYYTRVPVSAMGQVSNLVCDPNPLDFGEVKSGQTGGPKDLTLRNDGSDDVVIQKLPYFRVDSSQDFHMGDDPSTLWGSSFPVTLRPGESTRLVFEYAPTGGDRDEGYLEVDTLSAGNRQTVECVLMGVEVGPKVVVSPGEIDFGSVALGDKGVVTVTLGNGGYSSNPEDSMLIILQGGIKLGEGSDSGLSLLDEQGNKVGSLGATEWKIKSAEFPEFPEYSDLPVQKTFSVEWAPQTALPDTGLPIGTLLIGSNDPVYPLLPIPIRGRVAAPIIAVMPNPVSFGVVAQTITSERTLTIRNDGNADLEFTAPLTIEGDLNHEFEVVVDNKFAPTSPSFDPSTQCVASGGAKPEECVIHGGDSKGVVLRFTNKGGSSGSANATLVIKSNSPGAEEIKVGLEAIRTGIATCEPVIMPASLNYGTVAKGYYKDMMMKVVNQGTGYCSFQSARVEDCTSAMGMEATCAEPGKGQLSKYFVILSMPPAIQNGLGPGGSLDFKIRFIPPVEDSIFAGLFPYSGLFSANIYDAQLKKTVVVPQCQGGMVGGCSPNLQGQSGVAKISVLPGEVDFGVVTIGCCSKTYRVCLYNTGTAPLTVSGITPSGCTAEFKVKNTPTLPKAISAGVPVCFDTQYCAQQVGQRTCSLQIESTDSSAPLVSVRLKGEGTNETSHVDRFTQVSGQEVDVLFIVDDSGSMCEEQDKLAAGFDYFIQNAKVWNNDYHIGVISLNVVADPVIGKLNYGDPKKMPRYLTPQQGTKEKFAEFTKLGCGGGPYCSGFSGACTDEQESGLQAAMVALSAPLTTDTGVPCNSDADCKSNTSICSDANACPYYCLDGTCGGWNKGFLRDNAQLEIVVLSDEEDQSPDKPAYYIDFLKNIKGYYNVNMMHFHSIVGQDPSTCSEAEPGKRYLQVSDETNGVKGDICASDYGPIMDDIGDVTFGLKVQFFLSRLANPSSISVKVNGQQCTTGWTYDGNSNSIIFDGKNPNDPCSQPAPGQVIEVSYDMLCLKE